jgi:hypothetical protein
VPMNGHGANGHGANGHGANGHAAQDGQQTPAAISAGDDDSAGEDH